MATQDHSLALNKNHPTNREARARAHPEFTNYAMLEYKRLVDTAYQTALQLTVDALCDEPTDMSEFYLEQ